MRSCLRRRHPFFEHSEAAFFLAVERDEDVGRIAVLEHRPYNDHHGTRTAFFTHFDVKNDDQAAGMLFDAAAQWAAGRGLDRLVGPKSFTRSAGQGILVGGFEYLPATGIPWNPPYYKDLIEGAGFSKVTDLMSGYIEYSVTGDEKLYRVADIARKRGNFDLLSFRRRRDILPRLNELKTLQHAAFADNPNYVPSTDAEVCRMAKDMIRIADLDILRFITRNDRLAGFLIAYPNISRGIKRARGEFFPAGWFHILKERSRSRALDLNALGILPRYQKQGGDAILFAEAERLIRSSRYISAEVIQVDEKNFLSRSGIEHFGITWSKRHRVYGRDLEKHDES